LVFVFDFDVSHNHGQLLFTSIPAILYGISSSWRLNDLGSEEWKLPKQH
jgi:hypothetical protein